MNTLRASAQLILALEELPRWFKQRDRNFEPPISTFEPTKKEANVFNVNTIPGEDVFYLDRVPYPGLPAYFPETGPGTRSGHGVRRLPEDRDPDNL